MLGLLLPFYLGLILFCMSRSEYLHLCCRVCPLCRGDVRGVIEGAAPSSSSVGLT